MRRLFGLRGGSGRQDVLITGEAVGPLGSGEGLDACVAHKNAKKQGAGQKKKDGLPKRGGDKVRGREQTLHGLNRCAGRRNRRSRRDTWYDLALKCPRRDTPGRNRRPTSQGRNEARRPSYPTISTDTPVSAQEAGHLNSEGAGSVCERSFSATLVSKEDSVAALDTGATANPVCSRWLKSHN